MYCSGFHFQALKFWMVCSGISSVYLSFYLFWARLVLFFFAPFTSRLPTDCWQKHESLYPSSPRDFELQQKKWYWVGGSWSDLVPQNQTPCCSEEQCQERSAAEGDQRHVEEIRGLFAPDKSNFGKKNIGYIILFGLFFLLLIPQESRQDVAVIFFIGRDTRRHEKNNQEEESVQEKGI